MAMELHHLHTDGPKPLYKKIALDEYNRLRDENAELREKVAMLEEAQRWRKVSEELPSDEEPVVVCFHTEDGRLITSVDCLFDGEWQMMDDCEGYWMPLPSAPKENDDAQKD